MTTPRIPQWVVPAALGALVVILGAVALIRGGGDPDPATPEGALRLYLEGIASGDFEQAYRFLDPQGFQGCDPEDIEQNAGFIDAFTALHRETRMRDGTATIVMDIRFDGGFIGFPNEMEFQMVERDGFWYVTGDPWPYFSWNCRRGN